RAQDGGAAAGFHLVRSADPPAHGDARRARRGEAALQADRRSGRRLWLPAVAARARADDGPRSRAGRVARRDGPGARKGSPVSLQPGAGPHVAHTVCPLDCPDRCSLEVTVDSGRVTAIEGSRVNPVTEGFICGKVRNFTKRLYGPERLLQRMRRTGKKGSGTFEAISWDEAIATIAARFAAVRSESGGEAILPFCYGGSNGLLTQDAADARLFRGLG